MQTTTLGDRRTSALVIGAGPAGAAAGITLARAGIDVCVVDRARFPRPKPCGDALSNRALALVRQLIGGAALEALPQAEVRGAAVLFPGGVSVRRGYREPGRIIPRAELDAALHAALRAAGAQVEEGLAVRELLRDERGRVCGASGDARRRWRAEVVIAADGPGSLARRSVGAPPPRGSRLAVAATAYAACDGPAAGGGTFGEHYLMRELPCGYGWVFPPVAGLANIGVYQRADRYRQQGVSLRERFDAFVASRGLGEAIVGDVRVGSLPLCATPAVPGAEGLLLCGDAAGLVDPLSGEGIWQALRSGILAGRIAAHALVEGGLSLRWARRYQRVCAQEIGWPSLLRVGVQEMLQRIVAWRLYEAPLVRQVLTWGYRQESLEMSKSVGALS